MAKPTVAERLWSGIAPPDDNECRLWTRSTNFGGYGKFPLGGKEVAAHRVAYELTKGPIPEGLVLDHLCRVRLCCNPDHLEPVTHAENVRRGERATKTHCINGHAFTPENTYITRKGWRHCRACRRK